MTTGGWQRAAGSGRRGPAASRTLQSSPCTLHVALCILSSALLLSCASGPPSPASLDTANDTCVRCRMAVSDRHFAAQISAPGEEPLFFDDLGCLRDYLAGGTPVPQEAVIYVADHRTGEWVDARRAVFWRRANLATPMASGLMAHRDTSSAREDPAATGALPVEPGEILFGHGVEGGR